MKASSNNSSKPHVVLYRSHLTELPRLSSLRRLLRVSFRYFIRLLVWICLKIEITGINNIPLTGPALIVGNHLGDIDLLVGIAHNPRDVEVLAKSELFYIPVLGKIMDAYGVIWVHRGSPDRGAIRSAVNGLAEGRLVGIAPEARESLTGSLEKGTNGGAYIALKAGVPVLPVTFTGTENHRVLKNLKHFRKTHVTLTIGPSFYLQPGVNFRTAVRDGTNEIMQTLANQLPAEYHGIY